MGRDKITGRDKIKVGVSSCLLGEEVRYNGGHKKDHYMVNTLGRYFDWVPVCPEVQTGLPVPREAMRLVRAGGGPRLVTVKTNKDYTNKMLAWADRRFKKLEKQKLCGFIFKSKSPSCGIRGVRKYSTSGAQTGTGPGLFGGAFLSCFPLVPIEDESRLLGPSIRENFIAQVFFMHRWREFVRDKKPSVQNLAGFHQGQRLLLMSHSPACLRSFEGLLHLAREKPAGMVYDDISLVYNEYISKVMEALRLKATPVKNAKVLMHMLGYLKKTLSPLQKKALLEAIAAYRDAQVPLTVPVTLFKHHAKATGEPYLCGQSYLNPHPPGG